jgi:hypothetical protein
MATRGAARARGAGAARVRGPRPRPAQRARPSSAAALLDELAVARRRRVGDGREMGGSPAQGRRRGAMSSGEQRRSVRRGFGRDGGAVDEAVGTRA